MSLAHIDLSFARKTLKRVFGHATFKPGQEDVLRAVLAGEDVLAVMPTGSGKSLCYQLPAVMRPGLTVVVSPLIALMRDQVLALEARGVACAALHALNKPAENALIWRQVASQKLQLLYISPERLALPHVQDMLARARVQLVAVDEAHCLSQWGHDFRPDYRDIPAALKVLGQPQTMALTASADGPTRDDLVTHLFARAPRVLVRSFLRPNLRLAFTHKGRSQNQILRFVGRHRRQCGLVYVATRRRTEVLAALLRHHGHDAHAYHAGLEPTARKAAQDAFLTRPAPVIVGTVAFGLGIDRADVRFVCHGDMPASVEAYYQEIGRAGRDGKPAETLTLFGEEDLLLRRLQIADHDRNLDHQAVETRRLIAFWALCQGQTCRQVAMLAALGELTTPCGRCDHCRDGLGRMWRTWMSSWQTSPPTAPALADLEDPFDESLANPFNPPEPLPPLNVVHAQRLAALQAARLHLAKHHNLPPVFICSEQHLRALARGVDLSHLPQVATTHLLRLLELCPQGDG